MKDALQGCSDALDRIPLFVGEDLEDDERTFVREHLALCQACAERAEIARAARTSLQLALRGRETNRLDVDLWSGVRVGLVREGLLSSTTPNAPDTLVPVRSADPSGARRGRLLRFAAPLLTAAAAAVLFVQLGDPSVPADPAGEGLRPGAALSAVEPAAAGLTTADSVAGTPTSKPGGLRKVGAGEERLLDDAEAARSAPHSTTRPDDEGARLAADGYR